jgi:hypothetical protein
LDKLIWYFSVLLRVNITAGNNTDLLATGTDKHSSGPSAVSVIRNQDVHKEETHTAAL